MNNNGRDNKCCVWNTNKHVFVMLERPSCYMLNVHFIMFHSIGISIKTQILFMYQNFAGFFSREICNISKSCLYAKFSHIVRLFLKQENFAEFWKNRYNSFFLRNILLLITFRKSIRNFTKHFSEQLVCPIQIICISIYYIWTVLTLLYYWHNNS